MNLVNIGIVLDNNSNILGMRVLDTDTSQVKDIAVDSIKKVLYDGKVKINGLCIRDGELIGSNGSLDRYPKIINGQLVGKSPLIILNQLEDVGYTISDFNGRIASVATSDVVKYASLHGIANGKVVSKEGKEFISAIVGSYDIKALKKKATKQRSNKKELYRGELIESIPALKPIISYYQLINHDGSKLVAEEHNKYGYDGWVLGDITRNGVYETDKYTLFGTVSALIPVRRADELRNIIRIHEFRRNIDKAIYSFDKALECNGIKLKIDNETGLYKPDENLLQYYLEPIMVYLDDSYNKYDNIDEETIEKYLKYVKVMFSNHGVRTKVQTGYTCIVLSRRCTINGIDYKVLETDEYERHETRTVRLEEICAEPDKYINVTKKDGKYIIRGLDGAYEYDIDLINSTYKRGIVQSTKVMKAKLLGKDYKEVITEKGELRAFSSEARVLGLPNTVIDVCKESITVTGPNEILVFNKEIKSFHKDAIIARKSYNDKHVSKLIIESSKEVGINILKSVFSTSITARTGLEIEFTRDITPSEYCMIRLQGIEKKDIKAHNIKSMDNKFMIDVFDSAIEFTIKDCTILENPIQYRAVYRASGKFEKLSVNAAYKRFKGEYNYLTRFWNKDLKIEILNMKECEKTIEIIEDKLRVIDSQLVYRQNELSANRKETLRTIPRYIDKEEE